MAMTPYSGDTSVIGKLGTTPQERGLTTQQFKDKFDEGLKEFVTWFNSAHKTEFDAHLADSVTDANGAHGLKVESGTFTPTLEGSDVAGVHTYTGQTGVYVKIGNLVHVSVTLALSAKDPAMSGGNVYIKNLPFIPKYYGGAAIGNYRNIAIGSNNVITARIEPGIGLRFFENGDSVGVLNLSSTKITDTTQFYISATYIV